VDWIKLAQDRVQLLDPVKHGNESNGSIKGREFRDWLSDYQLFMKGSVLFHVVGWL
jgi:hypothetical protein